jgi:hypothetical protein
MEEGLIAGIAAIFLGMLAIFVGWTIIGGLGLGITALLLAIYSYRKGHRLLGVFGILFSCVGVVEGLVVAGMIGFLSVLTMPTGKTYVAKMGESIRLDGLTLTIDYMKVTDKLIIEEFGRCYACSAKPNYKIVILYLTIRNEGTRKTYTPSTSNFIIEVDKGYQYEPIWPSRYDRQSWEIDKSECLQYYCRRIESGKDLLPEEEEKGCIFFEILERTNPAKLMYEGYIGGRETKIIVYLAR